MAVHQPLLEASTIRYPANQVQDAVGVLELSVAVLGALGFVLFVVFIIASLTILGGLGGHCGRRMLVGAEDSAVVERARPVLETMATHVWLCGGPVSAATVGLGRGLLLTATVAANRAPA